MTYLPDLAGLEIPDPTQLDAEATLQIYQALRPVLPPARPASHQKTDRLVDCLDSFDAFILDGFGVINVGIEKIKGIDEFFQRAELAGKPVVILTNAASAPSAVVAEKYLRWGLPVTAHHVVSSRDALVAALPAANQRAGFLQLDRNTQLINGLTSSANACLDLFDKAEGFVFLGFRWDENDQVLLGRVLARMRPVCWQPDVSAHICTSFQQSRAIGWRGNEGGTCNRAGLGNRMRAFQLAGGSTNGAPVPKHRIAMVGDSPQDILHGAVKGLAPSWSQIMACRGT